ncbi:MAG: hypothetical protein JHC63_10700 [Acidimicrobiia bacterium]|nr:hypothetical protein [Acidimicrobiia bacterium]
MKLLTIVAGCFAMLLTAGGCSSDAQRTVAPVHWDLNAIIEPTTLRIASYIGSSSCDAFDSFKVVETDDQVEITVLVSSKQPGPCTMDMRIESIDVVLAEPLGERELTGCLPFEARPGESDLGCRTIIPYP